jgi:predicted nucleic acid-binding protein
MADAIVYATAWLRSAELVTSDKDFADLPDVTYIGKP